MFSSLGLLPFEKFWRIGAMETTVPTSSPIDFGASIEDQFPDRFPSKNNCVYPRLKVLARSGVNPPSLRPNETLRNFSGFAATNSSNAKEYARTTFRT